jgi:hypothetical protein
MSLLYLTTKSIDHKEIHRNESTTHEARNNVYNIEIHHSYFVTLLICGKMLRWHRMAEIIIFIVY